MNLSPSWIGFLRGLGVVGAVSILGFISVQTNDVAFGAYAPIVAGAALWLEGIIQKKTGSALFGAAK